MSTLTLFILPSTGNYNVDRKVLDNLTFFGDWPDVRILDHPDFNKAAEACETDWFFFLYDNESIDDSIKKGLVMFMDQQEHNAISFYKEVINKEGIKIYQEGIRLYQKDVRMRSDVLLPEDGQDINILRSLDGFIREDSNHAL